MSVSVEVFHEPEALRIGIQTHRLPLLGENRNNTPFPVVLVKFITPEIEQLLLSIIFIRTYTYLALKSMHKQLPLSIILFFRIYTYLALKSTRKLYPMRFRLERWGSSSFFKQL